MNKYKHLKDELKNRILDFTTSAEYFVDIETAKAHLPKPVSITRETTQATQQAGNAGNNQQAKQKAKVNKIAHDGDDDDGFWSDDDVPQVNEDILDPSDDEQMFAPNPNVKKREIRSEKTTRNIQKEKTEEKQKQKSKQQTKQLPKIAGNVDDSFFSDDEEKEPKIPANLRIPSESDDDDGAPLRPNPLVAAKPVPAKVIKQAKIKPLVKKPTPQKADEKPKEEETQKIDEHKEEKIEKKVELPTLVQKEENGFFDDDDDDDENENDVVKESEENESDDDETTLKPNPLVAAKPVPAKVVKTIPPKVVSTNQKNNEQEENAKECEKHEPQIELPTVTEKEDDGFFDDDDDDENEETNLNNEDEEEEVRPNPHVVSQPKLQQKPVPETKPEVEETKPHIPLPTVEIQEEGNDGFFDDNDDENGNDNDQQELNNDDDDNDEISLKPNILVAKPEPKQTQINIPSVVEEAENDAFFDDDDNDEAENNIAENENTRNETDQQDEDETTPKSNQLISPKPEISLPIATDEKVDDDFFNDDDEPSPINIRNNNTKEDDSDDVVLAKPNPLVASGIKSNLQQSIMKSEQEIHHQDEIDDFFANDDQEPEAQPQNSHDDYGQIESHDDYGQIESHDDYGELDDQNQNESHGKRKKIVKAKPSQKRLKKGRKKKNASQSLDSVQGPEPTPSPSVGDYDSI
ncbi:hypothetical protein TRFO_41940 [Tritrichomonas foetus]|uniref:Uncharacterized protein n=1 Tax=Tritrichomonas foetus TaxID=1144522 RepID=A0A1J4KZF1_9EUKA|nr:hypothetical protein TRFO_41940 [Tritrichomonas foetus]|eukprot:OHT16240.1 hypothetical protein TRFO_41940 [Tritrichomonas foetus]